MIARAFLPGGLGLLIAGAVVAILGMSALLAALRWPVWAPSASVAATVRVLSPADAAGLARAADALTELPDVRAAVAMKPERAAELLAAWSGAAAAEADLAGLALIEVDLAPGADPAKLEQALAAAGVTAEVFAPPSRDHSDAKAIGAVSLVSAAAGLLAFALIASARLAASRSVLATLADLGANPARVAAAAAWPGLRWGIACAAIAAPLALAVVGVLSPGAAFAPLAQIAAATGAAAFAVTAAAAAALSARILYGQAVREAAS